MEKLYSILRDLMEVSYNQESLLHIFKVMQIVYNQEQKQEEELIVNNAKFYLQALQMELDGVISRLDNYIVENKDNE